MATPSSVGWTDVLFSMFLGFFVELFKNMEALLTAESIIGSIRS